MKPLGEMATAPGFRRTIRDRISRWTRLGFDPAEPPETLDAVGSAEWAIFSRYRHLLGLLGLQDADGFARWASAAIRRDGLPGPEMAGDVTVFDPRSERPVWLGLEALHDRARSLVVTLAFDPDPASIEVHAIAGRLRERLLGIGFEEEAIGDEDPGRTGPARLSRLLFRDDSAARIDSADGLLVNGTPGATARR